MQKWLSSFLYLGVHVKSEQNRMIDGSQLALLVEEMLDGEQEFLVDLKVSPTNEIRVLIDSTIGVSIDRCVGISRAIEAQLDRDVEDFSIEVSSAGLSEPFLHYRQYLKHVGSPVSVLLATGERLDGILQSVGETDFVLEEEKVIPSYRDEAGKKHKKRIEKELHTIAFDAVKATTYRFV